MLTPHFSCSQTTNSVIISIYVPAVRASDVEIHVEGKLFSLHINPYFLRLNLPKPVREDDASSARYDPSNGFLTVTLSKEVPGENFEDLDLLAKLLAPKLAPQEGRPAIEVVNEDETLQQSLETGKLDLEREHNIFLEAAKNDWRLPQSLPKDDHLKLALTPQRMYGFLDSHSGYFRQVAYAENEVNDLGADTEILTEDERRSRGEKRVNAKFDSDYYLADFVNDEEIQEFLQWKHPYSPECPQPAEFTKDEKLAMLRLPRKEYLPTALQTNSLYLTLVSILFSFVYDTRTTLADSTTESAWTVSILTPAFASLSTPRVTCSTSQPQDSTSLRSAFIASYRRALAFPLYRSFALCERCRLDVADVLSGGRRAVLRSLLKIKAILDKHDVYYVYSKIWLDDYCVWIQTLANEQALHSLSAGVRATTVEKCDLGFDLEDLEKVAREAMERAPDSDDEDDA